MATTASWHMIVCTLTTTAPLPPLKWLVKDDFTDGNSIGWKQYGSGMSVTSQRLTSSGASVAVLDTNFGDLVYDATIAVPDSAEAGLIFGAANVTDDMGQFNGYHAKLSSTGDVTLEKFVGGSSSILGQGSVATSDSEHHIRVIALGSTFQLFVEDMESPVLSATDDTFSTGTDGVRASAAGVKFGAISVSKP
ncbi:hypothetical protein GGR57DRAFT_335269 [Xylariaceae sp. FL1272]|nr:hypothetical protein GGR57DRAFT_335269 [Xylariaceae sp. FL1272]